MLDIRFIPGASEPGVLPGVRRGHYHGISFSDYRERPRTIDMLSVSYSLGYSAPLYAPCLLSSHSYKVVLEGGRWWVVDG